MKTCKNCGWEITEVKYFHRSLWVDQWFEEICGAEHRNSPHIPIEEKEKRTT
jgi:hypothetical protein